MTDLVEVIGDDRWGARRLAALSAPERTLYASILQRFARGDPGPLDAAARVGDADADALAGLVERDLVGVDSDGAVVVAYPFSARATRHRVDTEDGRRLWAMCAIDAFAIPYLLGRPAAVHAREPATNRPVTVTIEPGGDTVRWAPAGATVVAARAGGGGRVADCACPHINLFASRAGAERYLGVAGRRGTILLIPDAVAAARAIFGALRALLEPPGIAPAVGGRRPAGGVGSGQP